MIENHTLPRNNTSYISKTDIYQRSPKEWYHSTPHSLIFKFMLKNTVYKGCHQTEACMLDVTETQPQDPPPPPLNIMCFFTFQYLASHAHIPHHFASL